MSNDLLNLLPPSITHDESILAAGQAAGDQEAAVRALIPNAYIWPRLDELPEDILDHLGWGLHIDGWEYAATRQLKVWLVRNVYDWHQYKGTEYGLALYWRVLLGRDLLLASPPHKAYLGRGLTDAERASFEAPHPEVRVYPFAHAGRKKSLFCGDCLGDPAESFAVFPYMTDALLRAGSRVELVDPLTSQVAPLHDLLYERQPQINLAQGEVEVRLPGQAVGQFAGRPLAGCVADHGAKKRLYRLKLARQYQTEIERRTPLSVQPGFTPRTVCYSLEQQPGAAGQGAFPANRYPDQYPQTGGSFLAAHLVKGTAARRIYKRFKLFDPARVSLPSRRAAIYLGAFRLGGMPAHTAEVAVDMTGRKPARVMHLSGHLAGCPYTSDAARRIAQVRQVGRLAKRLSDKVELSITNRKPVTASAGLLAGTVKAGDYRLEVF